MSYGAWIPSTLRPAGPCSEPGAGGTSGRGAIPVFRHLPGAIANDPFNKAARGNARFQGATGKKQTRFLGRLLPPKGPSETATSAVADAATLRGSSLESPPTQPPTHDTPHPGCSAKVEGAGSARPGLALSVRGSSRLDSTRPGDDQRGNKTG